MARSSKVSFCHYDWLSDSMIIARPTSPRKMTDECLLSYTLQTPIVNSFVVSISQPVHKQNTFQSHQIQSILTNKQQSSQINIHQRKQTYTSNIRHQTYTCRLNISHKHHKKVLGLEQQKHQLLFFGSLIYLHRRISLGGAISWWIPCGTASTLCLDKNWNLGVV